MIDIFTADTIAHCIAHSLSAATFNQAVKNIVWNSSFTSGQIPDIKQDLSIYLIEQEEKTIQAAKQGNLLFFYIAIAKRQIQSTKSKLFGRYVNHRSTTYQDQYEEECHDEQEEVVDDWIDQEHFDFCMNQMLQLINSNINTCPDLKRNLELLKMNYFEGHTYRQMKSKTGIPISRIHIYISAAKEWLRNKADFDLFID